MGKQIDVITERRIKEAANIADVVGDFLVLRRAGINYKCLCPFHDDHSPSMSVSPKRNIYRCFVCGAGGDPVKFLMEHPAVKLSYPDALRYLAQKYSIWIDDDDEDAQADERWRHVKPATPRDAEEARPLELLTIGKDWVRQSNEQRDGNVFVRWLRSLPWSEEQRKRIEPTLWNYCVGHWPRDGRTVWWQVDELGRVRTGKLMAYKPDGHRDKARPTGWVHSSMAYDTGRLGMQQCLFGIHLTDKYQGVPVNIVESEKTAVICAVAYGMERGVWMACGGLQNLKEHELKPLSDRGRTIYLWPDRDGKDSWQLFAESIQYADLHVWTRFLHENWLEEDGSKADIADIIVRLLLHPETADKAREQRQAQAWADGEPFLTAEEMADPRVREWRERMRRVRSDSKEFRNKGILKKGQITTNNEERNYDNEKENEEKEQGRDGGDGVPDRESEE